MKKTIWRWVGRMTLGGLAVAVMVGVWIGVNHFRGARALQVLLERLEADGEKLSLADFELAGAAPAQQPELWALTNVVRQLDARLGFLRDQATGLMFVAPGEARVRHCQPDLGVRGRFGNSWEFLDARLGEAGGLLRVMRRSAAAPVKRFALEYARGFEAWLPHTQVLRGGAGWLALAALRDLRGGDRAGALGNVIAITGLAAVAEDDLFLAVQLNRRDIVETGLTATWELLQADGWSDDELAELQRAWETVRVTHRLVAAAEMERVIRRAYFAQARGWPEWNQMRISTLTESQCGDCPYGLGELWNDVRQSARFIAWRLGALDEDERRLLTEWQRLLNGLRRGTGQRSWAAAGLPADLFQSSGKWRHLLSDPFRPDSVMIWRKLFETETQRELAIAAVALRRYELRHRAVPARLEDLMPEFVAAQPHDWVTGQPLRYGPRADGSYRLYAVGRDSEDDGGCPDLGGRRRMISIWDGRDAVWPVAKQD